MTTDETQEEEFNQVVWAYSELKETIDIEFNPAKIWGVDDELEEYNLFDDSYEEGLNITLTRKQVRDLIEDLQQWLDGEE